MHLRRPTRLAQCALSIGGLALLAPPARALTINPIYNATDPSDPTDATVASDPNAATIEATINSDIATLDSYIANPITISVIFEETTTGLADSNSNGFYAPTYANYLNALETKQTLSPADKLALTSLGVTSPYSTPAVGTPNPVNGNTSIKTNGNLLTALGFTGLTTGGFVEFNASQVNDSRTNDLKGNYDLQSAVAHELDEVLGIGGAGSQLNSVATGFGGATLTSAVSPLDLYRYSAGTRSYSTSNTVSSYFSIDGGKTTLVHFNQNGAFVPPGGTADGSDFADWGDGVTPSDGNPNTPAQVQDAYGNPYDGTNDTFANLGANEVAALDVVGWDLTPAGAALEAPDVPTPEPTSCGLIAIGLAGALMRRRRATFASFN
jgi:hypothetical protein